ncbi:helix-turn-helix domain-containing protein [Bacillus cereus]
MLIQRQKDLLFILIKDKKWHTFSQLAKELQCSSKTVQRDIIIIKEVLPSKWNLKVCKGKGVILYKPADSSCSELNELFIRNEMTFKILDILFASKIYNLTDLSEKLYISIGTLYGYLKDVEYHLNQFDLRLQRKPLKVCGQATKIIFMYQELYVSSYTDYEWPFTKQKEQKVHLYVKRIEEKLEITLYPEYRRKIMYLVAIIMEKKKQGFIISLENSLITKIMDTPFFTIVFNLNKTEFQNLFNKEEIGVILMAISCSKYSYKEISEYKEKILSFFYNSNVEIYRNIKELIYELELAFCCQLINNSEFIFAIIQYLRQTLSKAYFFSDINLPVDSSIEYIMNEHKDTFYKVKHIYTQWINKYSFKTSISNEDITMLTLYIEGICMTERSLHIRVLLLIEDGEKWNIYLKGILNFYFGLIFNFVNVDIQDIATYDYTSLNLDLIITTFSSVQSTIPIIRISPIPTHRELHDLKDFIYRELLVDD